MPNEADPNLARWKDALADEIAALDDGAILVGHSIGATILINVLADDLPEREFAGVFLIAAPFIGPGGWPSEDIDAKPGLGALLPDRTPIFLYHGTRDETAPLDHVGLYERVLPNATVRRLQGRDHQLDNDLTEVARDIRALA